MSKAKDQIKSFGGFLRECRAEIGKITWPNRHELVGSTWVVGGLLLLVSLFVFFSDQILAALMEALMRI